MDPSPNLKPSPNAMKAANALIVAAIFMDALLLWIGAMVLVLAGGLVGYGTLVHTSSPGEAVRASLLMIVVSIALLGVFVALLAASQYGSYASFKRGNRGTALVLFVPTVITAIIFLNGVFPMIQPNF